MITFSSRCGSESRREPKTRRGRAVPEPFECQRDNTAPGPRCNHNSAWISARYLLIRLSGRCTAAARHARVRSFAPGPPEFVRLLRRGLGYSRKPPFSAELAHETVAKLLWRQNPSLVNRTLLRRGRCAALIDAELARIATVASHRAGLVLLRAGIGGWRHALEHRTVRV